jgi:dTDP-4-dehydrorhamnose reductase
MKSILVTGANGQLGNALQRVPEEMDGFTWHFTDVDTLDICDKTQLHAFVQARDVSMIVNCAAYTAVDKAEDDTERCMQINRDAVRYIGEVAAATGAKVIHVSTDYVFDGAGSRPYREDDATNPMSFYGKSKLAGEQALQTVCPDAVIIRTAWLYSETGVNFLKTMLRLGAERDTIGVVADQQGTPTYAGSLAEAIRRILTAEQFAPGIYHYTDDGVCTWYDFAVKILEIAHIACVVKPLTTAEYPTRACRPAYSVLDKTKIKETYGVSTPHWTESTGECLQQLQSATFLTVKK